jgi:exopolysaccharide production protein ExoZ
MKFNLLQIGRGIAAILVVLYHFNSSTTQYFHFVFFNDFFKFGNIGVDFFFVLSGFIITYTHMKDLTTFRNWKQFFLKRFLRIYPIYWIICSITLLTYIVATHGYVNNLGMQLDINKIPYVISSYLLIPTGTPFFIRAAWSLTYEVLFYLFFGLCIFLGFKSAKVLFFSWYLLIIINQLTFKYNTILFNPTIVEFLNGCLVGYLIVTKKPIYYLFATCIFGLISPLFLAASIISFIVYFLAKYNVENKFLSIPLLIGDASYSIYLTHIFFMSFLFRIFAKHGNYPVAIGIFVMVVIGGILTHLFIEKPMLKTLNKKFVRKKDKVVITPIAISS